MRDMSSFYDAHLCHTIFKSHHRQLSHGPETNMLQVPSVTLTLKVATRILRVTRLLVMMINCTKQYLYSTIKNKVMVQKRICLNNRPVTLTLKVATGNFAGDTSSCYDERLYRTISKFYHHQESNGPETNLL